MSLVSKIARFLLGIDDTESSLQEFFVKDLSRTQKRTITKIDSRHLIAFIETLLQKHDLLELSVLNNRQMIFSSPDCIEKDVLKYYDFFENVKWDIGEKILMMKDNPWIAIFEKENFVFVTKKEIKLSEIEINAIAHDVLNNRALICNDEVELEQQHEKNKEIDFLLKKSESIKGN